jgi:hypothetical protein
LCYICEFCTFIILGLLIGTGISHPQDPPQAFTAGLAWTSAITNTSQKGRSRSKPRKPGKI